MLFFGYRYTQPVIDANGFAIAVGFDIANAFNSVPWSIILTAMEGKKIPGYLCRIVSSYLSSRVVVYRNNKGREVKRGVVAGVSLVGSRAIPVEHRI